MRKRDVELEQKIKDAEQAGKHRSAIAREFGKSPSTITRILGAKRQYGINRVRLDVSAAG